MTTFTQPDIGLASVANSSACDCICRLVAVNGRLAGVVCGAATTPHQRVRVPTEALLIRG